MPTARATPSELWLRPCENRAQPPRVRLVCMPHAGGTAQSYRTWLDHLPSDVAMYGVQYPGRQDRFGEPFAMDIAAMVAPIVAAVRPFVSDPLAIFGHSMGAYVAYEVTLELERKYGPVVDLLAVSGAPAPHQNPPGFSYLLDDDGLAKEVKRVNDGFQDMLSSPDLLKVVLPMIRADYRLCETYHRDDPVRVAAHLVAAGGVADPEVDPAGLAGWSACAADTFDVCTFPGGHFYLVEQEAALVEALAGRL